MVDDWGDSLQFPYSGDEYISNQAEGGEKKHRSAVTNSENLMSRQPLTNWWSCTTWRLSSRWYWHWNKLRRRTLWILPWYLTGVSEADGASSGSDVCGDSSMGAWTYRKVRDPLATSKVFARTAQCGAHMESGINTLQRFVKPQGLDLFLVHRQCCDMKTWWRRSMWTFMWPTFFCRAKKCSGFKMQLVQLWQWRWTSSTS